MTKKSDLLKKRKEHVATVVAATGWTEDKALDEMKKAKAMGMPYYRYVKNEAWKLTAEEIQELNTKIENRIAKRKEREAKEARKQELEAKKKEHIATIVAATGWTEEKAMEEMKAAKEATGMPYYRYVKNECWKMTVEEIEELNEAIEAKIERRLAREARLQEYTEELMRKTGWDEDKASEAMEKAKELGVPYRQYVYKEVYDLNEAELKEFAETVEKLREKRRANKEFYLEHVCRKTGWDKEKALLEMDKAKEEYDVSNLKFIQKEFWAQENKELLARFLKQDKIRINENKEKYVATLKEVTGWSRGKVELEVNKAKIACGASYEDFLVFKLYEKPAEEQKKFVTLDMFNKMRIKYNNHFESARNFDDKAQFNKNFKDFIEHKWFVNEDISYEEFLEVISGLEKVIIKPLAATQGKGIEVAKCNVSEEENRKLYEHIMGLEKSIVEQYIVQHDEMMGFCATSVNTVRIMTLNYEGECRFLYSVFRMGRDGVVDNFHAGGIAATIDIPTGTIITNAVDLDGNVFTHSPSTGKEIKGFKMPNWDKMLEVCKQICAKMEGTNLIGWDFAITPTGVDLIEGNPGASYVVAQIPLVQEDIGLAEQMAYPYL